MRLPPFTYLAPRTVEEAARMLDDSGPAAMVAAGGTDLYPNMKRRQLEPTTVVSLRGIAGLRGARSDADGAVSVGAMTTLSDVAASPDIHPGLVGAARLISSPQIRNVGTVGGNLCIDTRCNYYDMPEAWRRAIDFCLKDGGDTCWVAPGGSRCWAIASSDLAPVAIALDARVRLVSTRGERLLPVADLYRSDGIEHLEKQRDEILTEVLLPPSARVRATYLKLRRRGTIDFPILGVAASVRLEPDGTCGEARIVLGAVASAPLRAEEAERALVGRRLTREVIDEAARTAAKPAKPLDNADLTHYYRKWVTPVYVARALRELAGP